MATVTSNLTRINDLQGTLTLPNIGSGGGAGADTDIFLQSTQSASRRRSNVTLEGFWVDDGVNNDLSAAGTHVGVWVWVTHYLSLTDLEYWLGTSTTNYDRHNFDYANEYPKLGGWVRLWVHVNRIPEATGGTGATETTIRYFGLVVSLPTVGGTTPNVIQDAIDHTTTGLTLTGTSGLFSDFSTADETTTNQYGVLRSINGVYYCYARLTLGTATSLVFNDSNFTLIFPQQNLVQDTFMGITADLQNASTNIDWTSGVVGSPGTKKGDLIVTGTSGTFDIVKCSLNGLRIITFTSKVTATESNFNTCGLITQSSAVFSKCVFNTPSGSVGLLSNNPANISDCTFVSDGTGHGMEISTAGTYNFNGNTFTGYASTDGSTGNEAIYNNSGGAVTLNISGGSTPSIRNGAGASTTLVIDPVTVTITVKDIVDNSNIQNARVLVYASDNAGPLPFEDTVTITRSGSTATVSHTAHGIGNGKKVLIKGANQQEYNGVYTITVVDANSYTYTVTGTPATPATGTIKATGVILEGLTDVNGQISDTRTYTSNQNIIGRVRKATTGTLYKTGSIVGTVISNAGFAVTTQLIRD